MAGYPAGFEGVYRKGILALQASRNRRVNDIGQPFSGTLRPTRVFRGIPLFQGCLDDAAQAELMGDVQAIWDAAPPVRPVTRWGKPMSVAMTSAGALGWTTDRRGYRYEPRQPDGRDWPPIPPRLLALWDSVTGGAGRPDSCLVNLYRGSARMGLHQDKDEADLSCPVVSVSLGDRALFRAGGTERGGRTDSVWLDSGDVMVLRGESRLIFHGIDRIEPGSSALVPGGGRVNLTLRVAG
ncbi:alpha-ketoglutarate-dependent dioxygenase AlkB [Paracoccus sp. Z118]|nr:alpha-ketoglutarate-dependent dioxygenase AlkB [Paracoccus sp. Z118]